MRKIILLLLCIAQIGLFAQEQKKDNQQKLDGLKFRSIGPAVASGRVVDIAVNPQNHSERYIAAGSGNLWKTLNAGQTWSPIFDTYSSYSCTDVEIDPNNANIIWLGTGEFNSQRAIGFGDGVYVSFDRGQSFKNVGLKNSEHIGRIAIDPRNSDVYVAAQGPLWGDGGDRGLYKTNNYGETWEKIIDINPQTGINEIVIDPVNPDVVYATSYQRRRHVYTLIDGGEHCTIYKSSDAGKTWKVIENGLPSKKMGRIGLAISPVDHQYIYAIVEAQGNEGGIFRSTNAGASWEKMNDYVATSPQYYNRLYCDPKDKNKVFSVDTYTKYTYDGGKTWHNLGVDQKHVDDHCLWINPDNTNHLLIGCDGGLYESFDFGSNWRHIENLPITQFYRVETDNAEPFYNVYGGTQDNNTLGGPSQTLSEYGIINGDWYTTVGGDGFQTRVDPTDPNIIYSQAQYGWLVRFNKQNGERVFIQPQPPFGEAYRWNWNAPLLISPHNHNRLYFAANKVFKSDDRGQSWEVISEDLTRQIDRNQLKVMGKIQSPDAVAKNASTSLYGNIVSLEESPIKEGLLFVGTDDGLIQISEDGGKTWKKAGLIKNVPETTYVSSLRASQHDENIVYATFDGRKNNDFKPYVFKSTDKGKTWTEINNGIENKFIAYTIVEDFKNPELLFLGTEFGLFYSNNYGQAWHQLKNGIPTIPVKDISIQKRESDLVLATFGRGFYILDNYDPLRFLNDIESADYYLFPVKKALQFIPNSALYGQGATYYKGENPKMGVTFTYFVKETRTSLKEKRQKEEQEAEKVGKDIVYPSLNDLTQEDNELKDYLIFVIRDKNNVIVKQINESISEGVQRLLWDMTVNSSQVISSNSDYPFQPKNQHLADAGNYTVELFKSENGRLIDLKQKQNFKIISYHGRNEEHRTALYAFQQELAQFRTTFSLFKSEFSKKENLINQYIQAYHTGTRENAELYQSIFECKANLDSLHRIIFGNRSISDRNENQEPSLNERFELSVYACEEHTGAPTKTAINQFKLVNEWYENLNIYYQTNIVKNMNYIKQGLKDIGATPVFE